VVAGREWSPSANPYGYTTRELDPESLLLHYRARTHHPTLKQFMQRDPLGYVRGPDLYVYASANPAGRIDPLGTADGIINTIKEWLGGVLEVGPVDAWSIAYGAEKQWVDTTINEIIVEEGVEFNSNEERNDYVNTVRHLLWTGRLTQLFGEESAEHIKDLHELGEEDSIDSQTDQENNKIARELGKEAKSKEELKKKVKEILRSKKAAFRSAKAKGGGGKGGGGKSHGSGSSSSGSARSSNSGSSGSSSSKGRPSDSSDNSDSSSQGKVVPTWFVPPCPGTGTFPYPLPVRP